MKTRIPTPKRLIAAATAGLFLLSACFQDPASDGGSSSGGAVIEGQVMGEVSLAKRSAAGLEGATVTVVRLKADGSFETVSEGSVTTDAQGRFSIASAVEAAHGLMVVAKQEAKEFKAVVSGEVKKGSKTLCRPIDIESSVEAEVWAKVQTDGHGGSVSFTDIASHVDATVAAKAEGKTEVKAFLASQMETEAHIRASVLAASGQATRAMIEKMDALRLKAQADLEAALHATAKAEGSVSAEAKGKIEGSNMEAQWKAVAEAGIAMGEFAKAREAAFQAMVKAHAAAAVERETKLAWLKRIALHNALSLEAALSQDVKAAGGNATLVSEAGATLKLELQNAKDSIAIDSAFAKCRRSVSLGLQSALGGTLSGHLGLSDSSQARTAFELSLQSAATAEAVAAAYTKFYAEAGAEIKARMGGTWDAAKLQAATRAALLVNLQGSVSGGTHGSTGFGLNGSVEGNDSLMACLLATMDASANAQAKFLTDSGVGLAQASLLLITTARASARTRLETDIKAASGESAKIKAAYDTYHEALMEAYVEAGLDVSDYARSMQVYAQAMVKASVGLSLEARSAIVRSAHSQAARGLRSAVEIQMKAAGASEAVHKAAVDAGVALQAAVEASASIEAIAAAYESYHASVTAALRGVFLQHATAISSVDGAIRSEGGARAALMAAMQAEDSSEGISKAHVDFAAKVEAEVSGAFQGGLGASTATELKVIGQVLLLANMCG